MIMWCLVIFQW